MDAGRLDLENKTSHLPLLVLQKSDMHRENKIWPQHFPDSLGLLRYALKMCSSKVFSKELISPVHV